MQTLTKGQVAAMYYLAKVRPDKFTIRQYNGIVFFREYCTGMLRRSKKAFKYWRLHTKGRLP